MFIKLAVRIIVSSRLLMCHTERTEQAIVTVYLPSKSHFRIKEIEGFVDIETLESVIGYGIPFIIHPFYLILDMTILHIGIHVQSVGQLIIGFQVNIPVVLCSLVAVIFMFRLQHPDVILHPNYLPEMITFVTIESTTQCSIQMLILIRKREDTPSETIVHGLLAHQITPSHFLTVEHKRIQAIFHQRTSVLVFLIITVALGVMQAKIQVPCRRKLMIEKQLIILLHIAVYLVIVEVHLPFIIRIHVATRIESSTIFFHFLFRSIIPCMIRPFLSRESYQLDRSMVTVVSPLQIVGIKPYRCSINISVRSNIGQTDIERPMVID